MILLLNLLLLSLCLCLCQLIRLNKSYFVQTNNLFIRNNKIYLFLFCLAPPRRRTNGLGFNLSQIQDEATSDQLPIIAIMTE